MVSSQELARACQHLVVLTLGEQVVAVVLHIQARAAELIDGEGLAMQADALLSEDGLAAVLLLDAPVA